MIADFFTGLTILAALLSPNEQPQQFGAFGDPFLSIQLATDPDNGECLTTDGTNNVWSTCAAGGGGSGGGTWATTTSTVAGRLINHSLNTTDIVAIGSNSTTTAEFWFDPNIPTSFLTFASSTGVTASSFFGGNGSASVPSYTFTNDATIGLFRSASGVLGLAGTAVSIASELYHEGDSDTTLTFSADQITLGAGGVSFLDLFEGASDILTVNPSGLNVDFIVESDTHTDAFQVIGSDGSIDFGAYDCSGNANGGALTVDASGNVACSDDDSGGGGSTPDSKWATSTDNSIYPTGLTNSVTIGRTNQLNRDFLVGAFATSTGVEGLTSLFFASSTPNFVGNFLTFVDSVGTDLFAIYGDGSFSAPSATIAQDIDLAGNLLLGNNNDILSAAIGAFTFTANSADDLTLDLDAVADTAVWSSSTGVTTIDWSTFNLTTSGRLTSGTMTVTSLTSALLLTDGSGVFAEYAGSTCTNQAVTAISALGVATCTTLNGSYLDLTANYAWTGNQDFGGSAFLEIPNGTAPTANDPGEIAHDTTDNQLIVDDFVVGRATEKIWSVTVASTSMAFIEAGLLPIPVQQDGYTITRITCYVSGGTSKVVAVEDASANSTEDITCATTATNDDGSITNATFTASELGNIDFGATTGAVNYVTIAAFGQWTRE